jgi:hypothetical protein
MAKDTQQKEEDGRLVATTAFSVGEDEYDDRSRLTKRADSYQKGEYVDTSGMEDAQRDYYVEQGILVTETEWVGKYKEQPVEHVDVNEAYPSPTAPWTTAQGAAATQQAQPEMRREGDPNVTTTTSGQTPEERTTATRTASTTSGTDTTGDGPAADARKTSSTSSTTKK